MNRARVSVLLLSVLLWRVTAPCFLSFLPAPLAGANVLLAAEEDGQSAWVPHAIGSTEMVNAIRGTRVRVSAPQRPAVRLDEIRPQRSAWTVRRPHRSPYPTRHELRLRLSRSESGELPH